MALEIGIWEGSLEKARLIGETTIPLESAIAHNTDWWPLLSPSFPLIINRSTSLDTLGKFLYNNHFITSTIDPILIVSSLDLGVKPHELPLCLSESRSVPSSRRNSGRSDIIEPPVLPLLRRSGDNLNRPLSASPTRTMSFRHNSVDKITNNLLDPAGNTLKLNLPTSPRRKSATAIMSRDSDEPDPGLYKGGPNSFTKVAQLKESNRRRDSETSSDGMSSESDSINTSTLSLMESENGE